ncbi:hypothetical protein D5085_09525 [Ectothiorhodospiraceae bacterium BW-2]|nr:hypothetical protein D5085_09525 [Ectothiorhodospiraceae bacterium BW-2]
MDKQTARNQILTDLSDVLGMLNDPLPALKPEAIAPAPDSPPKPPLKAATKRERRDQQPPTPATTATTTEPSLPTLTETLIQAAPQPDDPAKGLIEANSRLDREEIEALVELLIERRTTQLQRQLQQIIMDELKQIIPHLQQQSGA